MSAVLWYLLVGTVAVVAGALRMLLTRDPVVRLVAMNVVGVGTLLLLMALAARTAPPDPVLSALVITGLVITVAFTGIGAVLVRRLEDPDLVDLPPAAEAPARGDGPDAGDTDRRDGADAEEET